jgi:hypothetical protein
MKSHIKLAGKTLMILFFLTIGSKSHSQDEQSFSNGETCRCHTSAYTCLSGSWFSFRAECNCEHPRAPFGGSCYPAQN